MADTSAGSRGALSAMNVVDLKSLASRLGIRGTARMRKDDIVAAISAHQSGGQSSGGQSSGETPTGSAGASAPRRAEAGAGAPEAREQAEPREQATREQRDEPTRVERAQRDEHALLEENRRRAAAQAELARAEQARTEARTEPRTEAREAAPEPSAREQREPQQREPQQREQRGGGAPQGGQQGGQQGAQQRDHRQGGQQGGQQREQARDQQREPQQRDQQREQARDQQARDQQARDQQARDQQAHQGGQPHPGADDDERGTGRRRNRQRNRDRKRRGTTTGQEYEPEVQVADDDVLVPVAGILDVLDNYAFVRTTGYLPGPSDVYVPLGLVKKHGLRKGDAVTGAVKALREGEQPQSAGTGRQKFNALVRLDSINGQNLDEARTRSDFARLTPLYPQERLRLETDPGVWTTRVVDLVAPVGKGSRLLVVAPPTTGRSSLLQTLATAVTTNNPECHVMVVLVDERPEEVTEMQRSVKGEVIASTFDRTAEDHTTIAELAVERAKRLVELGHDVVLLLDSLTALARAYNVAGATTGRILAGGLDAGALHPPKALFGAARKIENGGSLTIVATAVSDTSSRLDEAVLEELRGTANAELHLARDLTDRRDVVPVDVNASGTRREEQLLGGEQLDAVWKLRRVLRTLEPEKALDLLLARLRKSRTNAEFLKTVQSTSPSALGADA